LTVAGMIADGETTVTDSKCAGDSFPGFAETLVKLGGEVFNE